MTYKQVEQVEQFIKEAEGLKNNCNLSNNELYKLAKNLDKKLRAGGINYVSIISWNQCEFTDQLKGDYDRAEITRNIDIILSALQGLLDKIPFYPYVVEIKNDIKYGKSIEVVSAKEKFIKEKVIKYQGKIDFGNCAQKYIKKDDFLTTIDDTNAIFSSVLQKLEWYLIDLFQEKSPPKKENVETVVNVNQTQNTNQSQTADVKVSISFEECFKSLDDCETLDNEELEKIKTQIKDIQDLLNDRKGKKKVIRTKISDILKWIAEKGTDVMIAVLPLILNTLQGL